MAICECMDTVKVREGPSTEFSDIGRVYPGDIVQFQSFTENEGRVWGEIDYDKYCCVVDTNGSKYFKIREDGGNVSGNVSMLQKNSKFGAVRKSGCCFLCACYLGGLNNINEADDCWDWATDNNKVRASDSYVNIDKYKLATQIAERYGRNERSGKIIKGNHHFYVIDNNGTEIFNSAGPGYGH